jgi:hypothetical protein
MKWRAALAWFALLSAGAPAAEGEVMVSARQLAVLTGAGPSPRP